MKTAGKVCFVQFLLLCLLLNYYGDTGVKMSFVVVIELSCFLLHAYEDRREGGYFDILTFFVELSFDIHP